MLSIIMSAVSILPCDSRLIYLWLLPSFMKREMQNEFNRKKKTENRIYPHGIMNQCKIV